MYLYFNFISIIHLACDLDPCMFGECLDTPTSFRCDCDPGYTGPFCEYESKFLLLIFLKTYFEVPASWLCH